jgi:hypothetical protein
MKKYCIAFIYLVLTIHLQAQDNNLSLQFSGILFKDLADTLEKKTEIKIYYSDKWTDSLYLDINSKNESFESILNKTLRKNGFSFIITDSNKVIISKGYTIKTNFQEQYNAWFKRSAVTKDTSNYIRPFQKQESTFRCRQGRQGSTLRGCIGSGVGKSDCRSGYLCRKDKSRCCDK